MHWADLPLKLKLLILSLTFISLPIASTALHAIFLDQLSVNWIILALLAVLTVPFFLFFPSVSTLIGIGDSYIMAIAMMYGPSPCVVSTLFYILTASLFVPNRPKLYVHRTVFNIASMVCGAWLYSNVYRLLNPTLSPEIQDILLPAAALTCTFFLFNSAVTSLAISWASQQRFLAFWAKNCLPLSLDFSVSAVLAAFIVALSYLNPYYPLAVSPFIGVVWGWNKINKAKALEAEKHLKEQEELYLRTVESLALAVDAKDQTTAGHIHRVRAYALGLAKASGITDPNELMAIETGSLLHDIGKLAVDDYILNKPGKLSKPEFEKMKLHATAGDEILQRIQFPFPVAKYVRYHHERWDGHGYPDGLKGEAIPLGARILTIADAFDAIRSMRPYKAAFNLQDSLELLSSHSGTIYDPRLVELFVSQIHELEPQAELAARIYPELSFRKYFEHVERALSGESQASHASPLPELLSADLLHLLEFCSGIGRHLNLAEILPILASRLHRLVAYTTCVFYIDSGDGFLRAEYAAGKNAHMLINHRIELGKCISGWVAAYQKPIVNASPVLEFQGSCPPIASGFAAMLAIPLADQISCLGTITLHSEEADAFGIGQLELMQFFASQASSLIREALSTEKSNQQDRFDPLSNTYRVGYLSIAGPQVLDVAAKTNAPVSMISVDVDSLPQIINIYGTQTGDCIIRQVAGLIRAELREMDVIVRFGPQGFVALLSGVRKDQAARFAQRLQQQIRNSSWEGVPQKIGPVNCEVAIASYPVDGTTVFSLIKTAQEELAKKLRVQQPTADEFGATVLEFPPRA